MKPYKNVKVDGKTHGEHRLIWERTHGQPVPPGCVVHHKNHLTRDNDPSNLELMTYEEHARHHNDKHPRIKVCVVCDEEFEPAPTKRARQQTCSRPCRNELLSHTVGTGKGSAKLDDDKVREIRRRLASGERKTDLAATFGISKPTMTALAAGRTWRHVV